MLRRKGAQWFTEHNDVPTDTEVEGAARWVALEAASALAQFLLRVLSLGCSGHGQVN